MVLMSNYASPPPPQGDGDICLGFWNERRSPPRWECEDPCLERNDEDQNQICGRTTHFTNFALLLQNGYGKDSDCGRVYDFITGTYWGDLILVASCIGFIFCVCLVVVFMTWTGVGNRCLRGSEGSRVQRLRDRMSGSSGDERE